MMGAKKGLQRPKAYKPLPALKAALLDLQAARSAPIANETALASMSAAA
ncbi:hypothetical protein J2850_001920 [Azospirillum picis]|uniref:Transposase n=1 Tax=Azospirillum picis TaxID=488438 RepID=A0ABU0MI44_9PROT|nr:hypothetical protein [Azospirillum picis]MDQ0533130.1 hypothetical protein [Azospirillum picis]